jgi:hypothetical protein
MEAIKELLLNINDFLLALKVNAWYILLFIAAGYLQKTYFAWYTKTSEAWKTLILGSAFSVFYALLMRDVTIKATWIEFAASYIFATSLYELLLKYLADMILDKLKSFYQKKLSE